MATRSTNTYQEGLQSLIQDIASMQLLPDANVDFLMSLQTAVIQEAQAPMAAQAAVAGPGTAGPVAPPGPPVAPGPPAGPTGLAALVGAGGPGNGSAPLPRGPAAEELARMMG